MENLIFFICFVIFSFMTAVVMLLTAFLLSYKKHERVKSLPYECGLIPEKQSNGFNIKYYIYLVLFLIFDIFSILLYPIFVTGAEYSKSHFGIVFLFLISVFFIFLDGKELL